MVKLPVFQLMTVVIIRKIKQFSLVFVGIVNTKLSSGEYLVKGQKVTCFTNAEEEAMKLVDPMPFLLETKLREHGAQFENAPNFQPCVCVSNRVVTGQNPASATPMAEKLVKLLQQK